TTTGPSWLTPAARIARSKSSADGSGWRPRRPGGAARSRSRSTNTAPGMWPLAYRSGCEPSASCQRTSSRVWVGWSSRSSALISGDAMLLVVLPAASAVMREKRQRRLGGGVRAVRDVAALTRGGRGGFWSYFLHDPPQPLPAGRAAAPLALPQPQLTFADARASPTA